MSKAYAERSEDVGACVPIFVSVAVLVATVLFGVGAGVGKRIERSHWRQAAIERGYAQYDSQTGDWEWVERDSLPGEHTDE